jgi:hypothetical protein
VPEILKEGVPFLGIMTELIAEDTKGPGGVSEPTGDFIGGVAVDEESPQSLVLPMEGFFGRQEEARIIGRCYLITMSDRHVNIMLKSQPHVNS